ncbi:MAG: hypothetical protein ACK5N9_08075 [Pirellula sp.]|jgi:hypothetical protein
MMETVAIGDSTREARDKAVKAIPFTQLTPQATSNLSAVIEGSSYFRRMPAQSLNCEPEVLISLARNPEVLVSIWDTMGITRVKLDRTAQYQHSGNDGAGTTCKLDLIYGNETTHVYFVEGDYDGQMWPKKLTGKSVIILHQTPAQEVNGLRRITVWMDVFLKVDNIGADLVVRTLSPLVNKSADSNFVESVAFVEQISQAAAVNSSGLQNLISKLNVSQPIKEQFQQAVRVASARANNAAQNVRQKDAPKIGQNGYSVSSAMSEPNGSKTPATSGTGTNAGLSLGSSPNSSPPVNLTGTNAGTKSDPESVSTRKGQASAPTQKAVSTDSPTIRKLNSDKP